MTSESINYKAVLADIKARIAKMQATADGIRMILAQGPGGPTIPVPAVPGITSQEEAS
jgi:hypothetical protein